MSKTEKYKYATVQPFPGGSVHRVIADNPRVKDVKAAFEDLRKDGDYLGAREDHCFPGVRYKFDSKNKLGRDNHFQGIQRLRKGNYLAVTGGDVHDKVGHLFVIKMGSRNSVGSWRTNRVDGLPPEEDRVVSVLDLHSELWHAGGISVLGDVLAVPIYRKNPAQCKIVFYHMKHPEHPQKFKFEIDRPGKRAGAVALARLQNGHFLVAVWSDHGKKDRFDFYLSKSKRILDGFDQNFVSVKAEELKPPIDEEDNQQYQAVNFVSQKDGKLFLVGMHNTSTISPVPDVIKDILKLNILSDKDFADLYRVDLVADTTRRNQPVLVKPKLIEKVVNHQFVCEDQQANFDAAAGVHIGMSDELRIYCAYHFRSDGMVKFNEYRPTVEPVPEKVNAIRDGWIDMFEDNNYKGRRLSIVGKRRTSFKNLKKVTVQGDEFNDEISSIRYQLPIGYTYRLFRDKGFHGKHIDLTGTGKVEEISDLKKLRVNGDHFGDRVSSAHYI